MKKTLTSLVLGLVLAAGVSTSKADGIINFFTFNSTPGLGKVFTDSIGGTPAAGPTWMGQLLGGMNSDDACRVPIPARPVSRSETRLRIERIRGAHRTVTTTSFEALLLAQPFFARTRT